MNYLTELIKIYSSESSFFSKKRIESGIAFAAGQIGMMTFIIFNYNTMSVSDVVLWSTLQFTLAGYVVHQIQKQKDKTYSNETDR